MIEIDPTKIQWATDEIAQQAKPWIEQLAQRGAFDFKAQGNEYSAPALTTQMVDKGALPMDGWQYQTTFQGSAPAVPEGTNGYWVKTNDTPGQAGTGNMGSSTYRFVGEQQAPQAMARRPVQQEQVAPEQPSDGKTIYNSWDRFQDKGRAEVEGINRMPFVFSGYDTISLDPQKAMDQLYPAAWQESGVQKTIGPNGTNIAPQLQKDFNDPQLIDTTKGDWPSLVRLLMDNGTVDAKQGQALLGLAEPKKLNASFGGIGGSQALLGGMGR